MIRVADVHFNIRCSQQFFFGNEDFFWEEESGIDLNTFKGEFKGDSAASQSFDACNRCIDSSEKREWLKSQWEDLVEKSRSIHEREKRKIERIHPPQRLDNRHQQILNNRFSFWTPYISNAWKLGISSTLIIADSVKSCQMFGRVLVIRSFQVMVY